MESLITLQNSYQYKFQKKNPKSAKIITKKKKKKKRKFNWETKKAKTLGITFSQNNKELLKDNLEPKIKEFTNCIKSWEHRKLSLLGKITVIKSLALPKIIYTLTV